MRTKLEVVGAVLLLALLAASSFRAGSLEGRLDAAERVRDSLLVEEAAAWAAAEGWESRFADSAQAMLDEIMAMDTELASLYGRMEEANARVSGYVSLIAVVEDSLASLATSRDTTAVCPAWWAGEIDDDLLTARWRFERFAERLDFGPYQVRAPGRLVTVQGGDGRTLVAAMGSDPRVNLGIPNVWLSPPPPVEVQVCAPATLAIAAGIGFAGGLLTWEFAR